MAVRERAAEATDADDGGVLARVLQEAGIAAADEQRHRPRLRKCRAVGVDVLAVEGDRLARQHAPDHLDALDQARHSVRRRQRFPANHPPLGRRMSRADT